MKESDISGRGVDGMGKTNLLISPELLEEGKSYLLRSRIWTQNGGCILTLNQVTFISFTSCPAIVVVQDAGKNGLSAAEKICLASNKADEIFGTKLRLHLEYDCYVLI